MLLKTSAREACDNTDYSSPVPTDSEWHLIELHFKKGVAAELYIDSVLVGSGYECQNAPVHKLRIGQESACNDSADDIVYHRNIKVGTLRGGYDVFTDDFGSNDLSNWDTVVGNCTVVTNPF